MGHVNCVWLNMISSGSVPTSEADYNAHLAEIDGVMPTNGGVLKSDGSWEQNWSKTQSAFAQGLKAKARANRQTYIPIVQIDRTMVGAILDSTAVQATAAANLVTLMNTRYDAPWDGVLLDFEVIPNPYKDKLSAFFRTLSAAVKADGKIFGISAGAMVSDGTPSDWANYNDDTYSEDYAVIAQVSDFIDVRCYCYDKPVDGTVANRSIAPYWWAESVIRYALSKGCRTDQILMGVGTYCQYLPNLNWNNKVESTVAYAYQLASANNVPVQWVESNSIGVIREKLVQYTGVIIWVDDGDVTKTKLDLVKKYGLAGIDIFVPGCTDELSWVKIKEWRATTMAITVQLTGISSGYTPEVPVTITAVAANPALFDSIIVNYVSPATTGSIVLTPKADQEATTSVTVTVNNGKAKNNIFQRVFSVFLKKYPFPKLDAIADVTIET